MDEARKIGVCYAREINYVLVLKCHWDTFAGDRVKIERRLNLNVENYTFRTVMMIITTGCILNSYLHVCITELAIN